MKSTDQPWLHADRPLRILVVEDNEDYRDTVKMMLADPSYEIIEATDGREGLEAAKKHLPDLILCDINMPNMNGLELLSATKEIPELSKTPFVFLTARDDKNDFRVGMQLGADDYLTKPFTVNELLGTVRTQMNKKHLLQKYYASQNEEVKNSLGLFLPHEIHTPLNGILGLAELLKSAQDFSTEEIAEYAGLILESGQRLYHLLENFNLYSQIQFWVNDEKLIAMLRRQSSPSVREALLSTIDAKFADSARRASLSVDLPETAVQISRDYLAKIFEELIDNAFKFSGNGTTVTVTGFETPDEVQIMVLDEGRGMTKEQITKVSAYMQFERRQYEQQGAGLGLAVSRALAEFHRGGLTIESEPGKGTMVTVRLPRTAV